MLAVVLFTFDSYGLLSIPLAAFVGQFVSMLIISGAVISDVSETSRHDLTDGEAN